MRARALLDDRGDSLLEVLVAVVIIGVAVVGIMSGLLTSVSISDTHRKQASAGAYARNYAEALGTFVAGGGYKTCGQPSDYTPATVGFTAYDSARFQATVSTVRYWISNAWTSSGCTASTDSGLQQLTVSVASTDLRATESLVVVIRKPCGPGSACS